MSRMLVKVLVAFGALALLLATSAFLTLNGSVTPSKLLNAQDHLTGLWNKQESEDQNHGISHYTRNTRNSNPSLLLLVLNKDGLSWGQNANQPRRSVHDFLQMIDDTNIDLSDTSLGFLTHDVEEYQLYKEATSHLPFARITIFLHPGYRNGTSDRGNRHDEDTQRVRRGEIAKLRNYLMLRTLRDESHILWLDADVYRLSPGIIPTMISHSYRSDVGIITARCSIGDIADYDWNAWSGPRSVPDVEELAALDAGGNYNVHSAEGTKHLGDLIRETSNTDLVPLDSVGATILYIRAALIHQGLAFAYSFIVGTTWQREGWDGIESESICYLARSLGAGCFGMGGDWQAWHTDG